MLYLFIALPIPRSVHHKIASLAREIASSMTGRCWGVNRSSTYATPGTRGGGASIPIRSRAYFSVPTQNRIGVIDLTHGVLLADLDRMVDRTSSLRLYLGLGGFTSIFFLLWLGSSVPYAIIHDGLLMPLFACVVLGLAGHNWLSSIIGCRPLVFVGEGSYCLYLLHFNLWNLVHNSGVLQFTGLIRFDPWLSYVLMIALALGCMYFIEKPAQKVLRSWLNIWR